MELSRKSPRKRCLHRREKVASFHVGISATGNATTVTKALSNFQQKKVQSAQFA